MTKSGNYLTSKQWIVRLYRRLAVLQVVSYVSNCICLIVDSAVIGAFLGADAMASLGLAAPLCTLCFAVALVAGCGTNILCINESACGDKDQVRNRFVLSTIAALIIAAALGAVLFFLNGPVVRLVAGSKADEALLGEAAAYLKAYGLGVPAIVINMIFLSTFQMDGEKSLLVVATTMLTACNIALDILAAVVFKNGLRGMAIATTVSNYLQLLILSTHFLKHKKLFKLKLKKPDFRTMFGFFKVGYPMGIQLALMALMTTIANSILISQFGTSAVSVMAMIYSCGALLRVTGDAAGAAFVPVATLCDSEKNRYLLKEGFSYAQKWNFAVCICMGVAEFALAGPIARLYFDDPALRATAVTALRFFAASVSLYGACYLVQSTYLAIGETFNATVCSILADFLLPLVCIVVQSRLFGLTGFWASLVTGKAITFLIYLLYSFEKRKKTAQDNTAASGKETMAEKENEGGRENAGGKGRFSLGDLIIIPDMKYHTVESLSCEIRTAEDVTGVSEQIRVKMLEHGSALRMANALSLAVEEIASFVIRYGINNKRSVYVNVYMNYDGHVWTARIRDNGPTGNPLECLVTDDSVDEFAKIGIRMVSRMVKDMKYIRTVETNNIVMKVSE